MLIFLKFFFDADFLKIFQMLEDVGVRSAVGKISQFYHDERHGFQSEWLLLLLSQL